MYASLILAPSRVRDETILWIEMKNPNSNHWTHGAYLGQINGAMKS